MEREKLASQHFTINQKKNCNKCGRWHKDRFLGKYYKPGNLSSENKNNPSGAHRNTGSGRSNHREII